ncbi:MAG: L7Ae/L30e/S12e/Gadd45 family ribosomal protein [Christensenellales bacterium]|jgi:ribosomal protein L7Ae-like RNA K-turn-binding protein
MDKALSLLGLAQRAGKVISGSLAEDAVKSKKAKLLLLDESASNNTRGLYERLCASAGIPLIILPEGRLTQAIGKMRKVAAVTDSGFAKNIKKIF